MAVPPRKILRIVLTDPDQRRRAATVLREARAETTYKGHRVYLDRRWQLFGGASVAARYSLELTYDGIVPAAKRYDDIAEALKRAAGYVATIERWKPKGK